MNKTTDIEGKVQNTVEEKTVVLENVYKKIQHVRAELVKLNLKKTGVNSYSNFTYYELGDFLPTLNMLMDKYGLCTRFVIQPKNENNPEKALLEVVNSDNPEEAVVFYSETAEVEIGKKRDGSGGADKIQNLGGKITYMRRYLLMNAFEIIESDLVDDKPSSKYPLDDASLEKISKVKTLDELNSVCRSIKEVKGEKYQSALIVAYTAKKKELDK